MLGEINICIEIDHQKLIKIALKSVLFFISCSVFILLAKVPARINLKHRHSLSLFLENSRFLKGFLFAKNRLPRSFYRDFGLCQQMVALTLDISSNRNIERSNYHG